MGLKVGEAERAASSERPARVRGEVDRCSPMINGLVAINHSVSAKNYYLARGHNSKA